MLDEIFESFERDKKKRHGRPTGKRSLTDRLSGMFGGEDRRRSDDRYERGTRMTGGMSMTDHDMGTNVIATTDMRRHGMTTIGPATPMIGTSAATTTITIALGMTMIGIATPDYRKPSKKKRLIDLLEFDSADPTPFSREREKG